MTETTKRKTFPIPATCSECGHQGDLFVDDERVALAVKEYTKSRMDRAWSALMVRRVVILLAIMFTLGVVLGRFAR